MKSMKSMRSMKSPSQKPEEDGFHPFRPAEADGSLMVATYNVHRWVGVDGVRDPGRVARVIRQLGAGIVGLQEVTFPHHEGSRDFGQKDLARETGLEVVLGPTLSRENAHFGNVLLVAYPVLEVRHQDLSIPGREPRGAIDVDLDLGGRTLRVLATHLGLRAFERHYQVKLLYEILSQGVRDFVILMGDFNEWLPPSLLLQKLRRQFGRTPSPRTFPGRFPLFALDRIWIRPEEALERLFVHRTPLSKVASDHLPLVAAVARPERRPR